MTTTNSIDKIMKKYASSQEPPIIESIHQYDPLPQYQHSSMRSPLSLSKTHSFITQKPQKKKKKKATMPNPKQSSIFQNPFEKVEVGSEEMVQEIKEMMTKENIPEILQQLGMKKEKALGKKKALNQIQFSLNYLENGELPEKYMKEFQKLLEQ